MQRLAYIRGIAVAAAVAGWRASRNLLPLLRELVSLPDTAVRQALASQLTPMGTSPPLGVPQGADHSLATFLHEARFSRLLSMFCLGFAAKSWAEDGGEAGYTDAMELLDLGLHLIGDESEEVTSLFESGRS